MRCTVCLALVCCFSLTACEEANTASIDERLSHIEASLASIDEATHQMSQQDQEFYDAMYDLIKEAEGSNASEAAKASALLSMLQTIRSQVELYKNQHNDIAPNLFDGWDQLVERTDMQGRVGRGDAFLYGPYLRKAPENPFNGSSIVCSVNVIFPEAGWAWDTDSQMFYAVVSDQVAEDLGLSTSDVITYSAEDPMPNGR